MAIHIAGLGVLLDERVEPRTLSTILSSGLARNPGYAGDTTLSDGESPALRHMRLEP
jgi:hypothetical protein